MSNCKSNIFCSIIALIVASGLIVSGYFIGNGFVNARKIRLVTVKGLAEKEVKADKAIFYLNFNATSGSLIDAQKKIDLDTQKIISFLKEQSFSDKEIEIGQTRVIDKIAQGYERVNDFNRYTVEATITVYSNNVDLVKDLSHKTGELIKNGIVLTTYDGPRFLFTNINSIKEELIAEATKNARASAKQFAKDSGSKVGAIKTANQGVLLIHDKDSDYSLDKNINKTARIVSTVIYFLQD